ncbi:isoaspartyl peptidase/L-asparaginase [Flavobacteriaceae bacterium]|uniref:isoaspartyl peptidase/L-asparaginase family protein n=1 Tax=Candidatus Arcticimaribacter forsetii TaxID=2820661 RepID=UPI0020774AA5|nr:isoaspartyl peptidase/L-asparaginase [Candidatus Arcticimaribacter forsetii]MCH1539092.1 isoaspartyl peptidase/L-asparaginase [Flavobacteriaceae bacterium]MDA8640058.1 isoaspartyl peptidase/L-asparaginase [Flavobacteriaceae bacterium]MDB2329500.1 isoaspartyl peptidase/L-asparaginase [Flavobacteriaceae bacterium]MDB2345559.1 isoaspartyl peptidase/L-asparaginase [Flavobacteriaceae bacterium]MDB4620449.1 isoaspartyl peptidase/L-asparaginase [Flavobacteriaceae bacterium]
MKEVLKLVFVLFIVSCTSVKGPNQPTFGIVIHGGAGTILKENMTPEMEHAYENKLAEAISVGHKILKEGGSSQEAVEKTIHVMENSPLFNSGKGAVLTAEESIALDASFMNGNTLDAGAVAGVKHIKNPISAAIRVMKNSPHVMLAGEGADYFAANQGLDTVPESYFITENRLNDLRRVKKRESDQKVSINLIEEQYFKNQRIGTVGCVALDLQGNLSAGTSTGGMTNKKWGRIGDAPIIGAGTYANNASCGVSATGWGEFFIRSVVAHDIAALVEYSGLTINEASKRVMKKVKDLGGDGGVVVLDTKGNVAMEFNTPGMYRAHMDSDGNLEVKIYRDE